jgi:hypothetical protein
LKQSLNAVHHTLVSSVETYGGFKTGFDTGNLHSPTVAVPLFLT